MNDRTKILTRLHELEKEIELVKGELAPPRKRGKLFSWCKSFYALALSNWVITTLICSLLVAAFVKYQYGVNYFEDYQNIATKKRSASFYQRLGDKLMEYGELQAAEEAYNTALKINPNNIEATRGVLMAQIFRPQEGQVYSIPEVVDAKLEYLDNLLQGDKEKYAAKDKYLISYFKAVRYQSQLNYQEAKKWYEISTQQNPDFIAGYVSLGYVSVLNGDEIETAMRYYQKALEKKPDYAMALNNLAYCYLVKMDFKAAAEQFEKAYLISPNLATAINLGDSYRYLGQVDRALTQHLYTLDMVTNPKIEGERFISYSITFNFMPEKQGDMETPKNVLTVEDIEQKRVLVHYTLSLDYALLNNFTEANKEFESAFQLDKTRYFDSFIANKIISLENFAQSRLNGRTKTWFEQKKARLSSSK